MITHGRHHGKRNSYSETSVHPAGSTRKPSLTPAREGQSSDFYDDRTFLPVARSVWASVPPTFPVIPGTPYMLTS
jgi:hypothetical protein